MGRATALSPQPPSAGPRRLPVPGGPALRDLPLDGEGPLYDQIYRAIRDAILSGRVGPGARLPTTRALASELGVSRNTVVAAFEPLQAEGYVASRVGAGTFVAAQLGSHAPAPLDATPAPELVAPGVEAPAALRLSRFGEAIARRNPRTLYDLTLGGDDRPFDFRPCVPDLDSLGYDDWRRHLARTAHYTEARTLDYADPSGHPDLREQIVAYLARARGVRCAVEDVIVVGGVAQALDIATRLFVDRGDAVLIEDPHYLGARRAFEAAGAELVGAPVDAEGVDLAPVAPSDLARCRLAYLTPSHQYPTGVVLSLARRQAVLAWAEATNAWIVEDDYDSEFRYAGRAIPSLKSLDRADRVLYVGTFSKTMLPSMRIAYLVVPEALRSVVRTAKWLADWATPTFEQIALAGMLESGDFERHLRRARTLYAERRGALLEAIDRELGAYGAAYHDSRAGLHVLLRLADVRADASRSVLAAGAARGVQIYPAASSYLEPERRDALELVMGFGRLEPDAIATGVARLREVLDAVDVHD